MTHRAFVLISFVVALLTLYSSALGEDNNKAEHQATLVVPFMNTPPTIDGVIHEEEWQCAKLNGFISQNRANQIEYRQAEFWIGYDDARIYIAVRTAGHPESGLITRQSPRPGETDVPDLIMDDCLEFWFAPNIERAAGKAPVAANVYQVLVNGAGAISDVMRDTGRDLYLTSWRIHMRQAHSYNRQGLWQAEFAIDRNSFKGNFSSPWGIRVVRNFKNPWDQARIGVNVAAFDDVGTMPTFSFSRIAPIVKQDTIWSLDHKRVDLRVNLKNPSSKLLPLRVSLGSNPINQPRYYNNENVSLNPGEERTIAYQLDVVDPANYNAVSRILVRSQDGSRVYFDREFLWSMVAPGRLWDPVAKGDVHEIDIAISHLPTLRKLAVSVDFKGFKSRDAVRGVELSIVKDGSGVPIVAKSITDVKLFAFQALLDLPDGMNGHYQLRAHFLGDAVAERETVSVPFERDRFAWEGNKIGMTDKAVPPFTPLVVHQSDHATSVSSVLKEHVLSADGLWKQVVAAGEPLLSSPMRYEVVVHGKSVPILPSGFHFTERSSTRVVARSHFVAGELTGDVATEFDIDGMMKTTLDIVQSGKAPIERFSLVIPLRSKIARLLHPVTDDIRINYGGEVVPGSGLVWESKSASRNHIVGTFVPYIWVGNEYRGLCWFGESDRDWILDDKRSAQTLERSGNTVTLRVNFVNTAGTFERPAHLVYGLLATPAKPLPTNPAWENFCANTGEYGYKCRIMGASAYWNGDFYASFPRDRNFEVVRKISEASKTGKSDDGFFRRLADTWSDQTHDMDFNTNRAHIMAGGSPGHYDAVMPYTNLRGDVTFTPEWRTYQDEWSLGYFNKRVTNAGRRVGSTDFAIEPVRSRQDYLLYYYKQFLENGFDGIYWDNIFLESCFNPVMGPAYTRKDGQQQPFVDIFRSRELTRRMMTLAYELHRPNLSMAHMTNANIIPIFSFVGSVLGWEWRYGTTDFQDRFTPEYIRAVNLPFNNGCIPVQLPGIRGSDDREKIEWCERTQTGCTLVHQLNVWEQGVKQQAIRGMLKEFGVGSRLVTAHRYWDANTVASPSVDSLKWIAYSRPGKTIFVVCDYGDGGDRDVTIDLLKCQLPSRVSASDWETRQAVTVNSNRLHFHLKRHDFKVIVLEGASIP